MNFYRLILLVVVFIFSLHQGKSQDIPYSQQFSNLVAINPAFSGTTLGNRVNYFYRNQWLGVKSGFHDFGFTFDTYFEKYNSGIGAMVTNQVQGGFVSPSIDFSYTYIIKIDHEFYISMGIQAGITQKFLLASDFEFKEAETMPLNATHVYPDFATGVVGLTKNAYIGISADHLHEPFYSKSKRVQSRIDRKYTIFAGYIYEIETRLIKQQRYLSPNILYQFQGWQHNITWGSSFQYQNVVGGLWLRNNLNAIPESVIISAGYKTQSIRFTYSYDVNIKKKTTQLIGAHEISFTYLFENGKIKKGKGIRAISFLQ